MKLAIFFNDRKFSGKLTRFWTGNAFYHCGWVDEESDKLYDMHAIRRRRYWSDYEWGKRVTSDGFTRWFSWQARCLHS